MTKKLNAVLGIIIILTAAFTLYFAKASMRGTQLCIADGVRCALNVQYSTRVILLYVLYYLYITREEFNTMMVLRMSSKRKIWTAYALRSIRYSLIFTIAIMSLWMIIAARLYGAGGLVNWNMVYSDYAIHTDGQVSHIGFGYILIKGAALLFLHTEICLLFSQIVIWLTNNRTVPLIVIAAAVIGDAHFTYVPIFFTRFHYNILQWGMTGIQSMSVLLYLIGIGIIIFLLGYGCAEYKEFIGDVNA